jgi:hypothetical protein
VTSPVPSRAQPSAVPKLTPKQIRAAREAARREVVAREAARIEAARASTTAGTPAGTPAAAVAVQAAPPAAPERTDAERARDAGVFLRGVLLPVLAALAGFVGYRLDLDGYSEAQALDDGRAWVPLLAKYGWLDRLVTSITAPARLIARVRELSRPKPAAPPKESKP